MRALSGFLLAFGAFVLAAPQAAAQRVEYSGVDAIVVKNFIGTVKIDVASRGDVSLAVTKGADAAYPVFVDDSGSSLTVRSNENPDRTRWSDDVDWRRHHERAFEIFLEDYPTLSFSVPAGTNISFDSAVVRLDAGDVRGALRVAGGHVDGEIGDLASADLKVHGSADLVTGDIADALDISIHGSGDLEAGSAGRLSAAIHGSGDVAVDDVRGDAETRIHGSGDITLGEIGGAFTLGTHGSGDVKTGAVRNGASVEIHGSGDLSLADIAGETEVSINGSGDARIAGGRADNLRVRIHGSGDFNHMGLATNPDIAVHGSGDVHIRRHEGSVRVRGDGDVTISGVHYEEDD